ncbi:MAG: type IX secretion system outer membrane channel protein PorV [Bacteroidetes bacterium]|nr:type IX secretion system outer membrane channel protein PorV [Bacteroidota bacterium]
MNSFRPKFIFLFFVLSLIGGMATAQTNPIRLQSTAVPFMLISPDARSGGMGNLSLAMSPEANDLFGNTAKLPYLNDDRSFLINYTPWLKDLGLNDVYLASAGFYKKLDDKSSINSSLRFFSLGNIDFSDESGNVNLPSQRPSEFSYDLGYSILLTEKFSMGVTLRYIYSKLVSGSYGLSAINYRAGNTLAGDISLFYKQNEDLQGFHGGLLLSNLGGKISYSNETKNKYFIPANLGVGIGYLNILDADNSIEVGIDVNRLMVPANPDNSNIESVNQYFSQSVVSSWFNSFTDNYGMPIGESLKGSVGLEYNYTNRFYLRGGYFIDNNKNLGNMQYFTVGTSFQYQQSKFNISYLVPSGGGISKNPLSNTLRFGTIFYF